MGGTHANLEDLVEKRGRGLLRQPSQDSLTLRTLRDERIEGIVDAEGVPRNSVEKNHERGLTTIFGDLRVVRLAYRRRGYGNLHLADASLNLPDAQFSHGLCRRAAIEAFRGSFVEAQAVIAQATGQGLGKRQIEELAQRAAVDFADFYAEISRPQTGSDDVLVLPADGKGIVMRKDALHPPTAKAAEGTAQKLSTRLSKGEKANRKRMAEVGAVHLTNPVPRTAEDVLRARTPKTPNPLLKPKANG